MTRLPSFLLAGLFALSAQAARPEPAEFLKTWESLRAAVLANKIDEASALTHFPLRSIDFGHQDVKTAAAFKRGFSTIFEPMVVKMMKEGRCETGKGDPGYEANCGNGYMIFGFENKGGQVRLTYFGSINE